MRLKDCLVRTTVDVIEGKWKPIILSALKGGPRRYGQLKREVPEAAQKVLTQQLRELEADGILARKIKTGKTPEVLYSLTSYGRTLMPILAAMAGWGKRHRAIVSYRSEEDENVRSSMEPAEGAGATKRE
jgi:DNA-binding HxlR family transcriptional regulator